jgi:hypothetical protein
MMSAVNISGKPVHRRDAEIKEKAAEKREEESVLFSSYLFFRYSLHLFSLCLLFDLSVSAVNWPSYTEFAWKICTIFNPIFFRSGRFAASPKVTTAYPAVTQAADISSVLRLPARTMNG